MVTEWVIDAVNFRFEFRCMTQYALLECRLIVPPAEIIPPADHCRRTCAAVETFQLRHEVRIIEIHKFVPDA